MRRFSLEYKAMKGSDRVRLWARKLDIELSREGADDSDEAK